VFHEDKTFFVLPSFVIMYISKYSALDNSSQQVRTTIIGRSTLIIIEPERFIGVGLITNAMELLH